MIEITYIGESGQEQMYIDRELLEEVLAALIKGGIRIVSIRK